MDDFRDLLTGGLRTALDLYAYKEITDIEQKELRQETQRFIKQDSPNGTMVGYPSMPTVAGINAAYLIGGGLIAVALIAVLLKR